MTTIPVNLVAEGLLDEQVLRHLLTQCGRPFMPGVCYGKRGRAHLEQNLPRFNRASAYQPFIVLADLDRDDCPPSLVRRWLPQGTHPNMILRIAVREVESWLLADRESFAGFLGVSVAKVPTQPDNETDPKLYIVSLARRSRYKKLREGVAPFSGSTSRVGKNYVGQLTRFILSQWSAERARHHSPSLNRALDALQHFSPVFV
jgi:hypothetical protein